VKAMVYRRYGSPDVLQMTDVDEPVPKHDEVLIRVRAASINDWDWALLTGDFVNRLINGIMRPKKMPVLGCDIAGEVMVVGKAVTRFKQGDRVYGDLSAHGFGGFAEFVCAPDQALAAMPHTMTFVQAAAIPQAAMLSVQALCSAGTLQAGQKVLFNGGGGGVGTFGVQIAKSIGAEVTGVDSHIKLDMMRAVGFDHVVDYRNEDFTASDTHYDLIVDAKTNRSPFRYLRAMKADGVYVTVGGAVPRLLQTLILAPLIRRIMRKHLRIVSLKPNKDLAYINELFEAGKLTPVIDGPYPLSQLRDAFVRFGRAEHRGKIVITID
jgi:NADPH:quinone reductase-like Zn-dependent oxidoreductase